MPNWLSFDFILKLSFLPSIFILLWMFDVILLNTLILLIIFFIIFVISPLFFKYSTFIQKNIIFLNYVQTPTNILYLSQPEYFGLKGARNLYINYKSNITNRDIKLGVWHILPEKYQNWTTFSEKYDDENKELSKDDIFDAILSKGDRPVILYAHGNSNSRSISHRRELYEVLQKLDYHVIAFDYRSYGDSSKCEITELGVVEDTLMVYRWILDKFQGPNFLAKEPTPIYIWGHSLGTGISMHAFAILGTEISSPFYDSIKGAHLRQPNGIILESPFNNMSDELSLHILGKFYSWLPWFDWMVIRAVEDSNLLFKSDEYITHISSPVLILHAKDDIIVPYELGVKLYETANEFRPTGYGKVEMISFNSSEGLGHKYICRAKIISELISEFVDNHRLFKPPHLRKTNEMLISNEERKIVLNNKFL